MYLEIMHKGDIVKCQASQYYPESFNDSKSNENNDSYYGFRNRSIMAVLCRIATYSVEAGAADPQWLLDIEEWVELAGEESYFPAALTITYENTTVTIKPSNLEDENLLIEYMMYISCGKLRKNNAIIRISDAFDVRGREIRKKNTEPRDMVLIGTKYIGYSIYRVLDKSTSQSKNRKYFQYWMICEKTELKKNCIRFFCNNRDMLPFILGKHGTNLMSFKTYVKKFLEANPDSDFEMHPKIIFKLSAARKIDIPK